MHLHLPMEGAIPTMWERLSTYIQPWEAQLATMSERLCTYIWRWEEPFLSPFQKGSALTFSHGSNQSYHVKKAQHLHLTMEGLACHHVKKALHLHLTMAGTNPTTMSERHTDSSLPLGRNLDLENTKILLWGTQTSLWPFPTYYHFMAYYVQG